jgi:hypothetical protein
MGIQSLRHERVDNDIEGIEEGEAKWHVQEGFDPETVGATRVAPSMRNG